MKHLLSFGILLVVCAGCASTSEVHSPRDASAQLGSYQTFAVLPVATGANLDPETARAVAEAAEAGARDALRARGYVETGRENADLVFYLHGKSMAPVALTDWNYLPAPSKFGTGSAEIAAAADHRIFVETYDNHSKHQVWMGWLDCACKKVDPERIQHEIQRIIENFPTRTQTVTSLGPN